MQQDDAKQGSYTFSKKERICSKIVLNQLIQEQQTLFCYPYKCYYRVEHVSQPPIIHQITISVPKKIFRLAVDRNRIKRLTREAYRLNKHLLDNDDIRKETRFQILFVFIGNEIPTYKFVNDKIITILRRLSNANISAN